MKNQISHNYRVHERLQGDRRHQGRRSVTSPFGSAEWIKAVQVNYLFWPKQDRRQQERRSRSRRVYQSIHCVSRHQKISLTTEERQMLIELTAHHNIASD